MIRILHITAQSSSVPVASVMFWLGVLLVLVLVGGAVLVVVRRWLLDTGRSGEESGFDLASLRRLHAAGAITDREFEAARAQIIGAFGGDRPAPPPKPGEAKEIRAEPGFDLTGDPLPAPSEGDEPGEGPEGPKK